MFKPSNYNEKFMTSYLNRINNTRYIISITKIELNNEKYILGLDSMGLIHIWNINEDDFNLDNEEEINEEFYSENGSNESSQLKYPDVSLYIKQFYEDDVIPSMYSKLSYYKNLLFISGDFNTIIIKKENLENILIKENKNINKFNVDKNVFKNNALNPYNSTILSKKIYLSPITFDFNLEDYSTLNNGLINGSDFDINNDKAIFFSDNGSILLYDINRLSIIHKNTNDNNYYNKDHNPSIYTGKIIPDHNLITYGGNEGKLFFLNYSTFDKIGEFNINSNKYTKNNYEEDDIITSSDDKGGIKSIEVTPNFLIASYNNLLIKYNFQLNLLTQILQPNNGEINDIIYNSGDIILASNSACVLKYKISDKVYSKVKMSSRNCYTVVKSTFFERDVRKYILFILFRYFYVEVIQIL
jgi:hypothetical protein